MFIKVDNVPYYSSRDLVKKLSLKVPYKSLYRHFNKGSSYTLAEVKAVESNILKRLKTEKVITEEVEDTYFCYDDVNLADLMYALLNENTIFTNTTVLDDFIVGLPFKDNNEECFIQYFTINYPKIQKFTSYKLDYLLDIVNKYKNNKVIEGFTDKLTSYNKVITINNERLSYYQAKYNLSYNVVYDIYKQLSNTFTFTYENFINALEEKSNQLVQRRNKNKK